MLTYFFNKVRFTEPDRLSESHLTQSRWDFHRGNSMLLVSVHIYRISRFQSHEEGKTLILDLWFGSSKRMHSCKMDPGHYTEPYTEWEQNQEVWVVFQVLVLHIPVCCLFLSLVCSKTKLQSQLSPSSSWFFSSILNFNLKLEPQTTLQFLKCPLESVSKS